MCVAIYKPRNEKMPSLKTLKKCWDKNPDGAGVAFTEKGSVRIIKGFMQWKGFKAFFEHNNLQDYKGAMFLHFRIATTGLVDGGNTHPFPLNEAKDELREQYTKNDYVFMHNGVLPIRPKDKEISDTMELVQLITKVSGNPFDTMDLMKDLVGTNRLALIDKNEKVKLVGDWTKKEGVFYSNMLWSYTYSYDKTIGFGSKYGWGKYYKKTSKKQEKCYCEACGIEITEADAIEFGDICADCYAEEVVYYGDTKTETA